MPRVRKVIELANALEICEFLSVDGDIAKLNPNSPALAAFDEVYRQAQGKPLRVVIETVELLDGAVPSEGMVEPVKLATCTKLRNLVRS